MNISSHYEHIILSYIDIHPEAFGYIVRYAFDQRLH